MRNQLGLVTVARASRPRVARASCPCSPRPRPLLAAGTAARRKGETPSPRRLAPLARAFTLIELLLVLVILGVLAGIVVPRLVGRREQAEVKAAGIEIANISGVLKTFEVDCGRFPNTQEGLGALLECPQGLLNRGWSGPYLDKLPKDPWGQEYQYRYPGTHNQNGFDLWSYGPDGAEGGGDDIDNWTQKR